MSVFFLSKHTLLTPARTAKFSNLSSITLFIPASQGADNTRIYYVGFLGSWTEVRPIFCVRLFQEFSSPFQHKHQPVITVYETQANLADHEKIQGLDGMFSSPDH